MQSVCMLMYHLISPVCVLCGFVCVQYDGGARILLSSWGTEHKNYYSETARGFDSFSWSHQDVVAVTSVGNRGFKRGAQGSMSTPRLVLI
jgi:hypothetical protein